MIRSSGSLGFKNASSYVGSTNTTHSITMPGSFAVGDLLLANIVTTSNRTVSSFTGWTSILSDSFSKVYYKIAAGSDTASITLNLTSILDASIAAYGPTSGVEGTPNGNQQSGDVTCSAITVTTAGGLLIACSNTSNTVTTPSGFVQDSLVTPSTFNFYFFSKPISATGSTGTVLLDESSTANQGGALIYIKP